MNSFSIIHYVANSIGRSSWFRWINIIYFSVISGYYHNDFPYLCGILFSIAQFINILSLFYHEEKSCETHKNLSTFIFPENGIDIGIRFRFSQECGIMETFWLPEKSKKIEPLKISLKRVSDVKLEVIQGGKI